MYTENRAGGTAPKASFKSQEELQDGADHHGIHDPRNRQATVALADEGDEDRPVTGQVAIAEAVVAPRGTARGAPVAPGDGEGTEGNLGAAGAALARGEIREEVSPTSLPDEEATMFAFEMLPGDVQDAN